MANAITRRAVLAQTATVAAAAPLTAIPAIADPATGPDQAIFARLTEWQRLRDIAAKLFEPYSAANDRYEELKEASGLEQPGFDDSSLPMSAEVVCAVRNMPVWAFSNPEALQDDHPYRIWSEADERYRRTRMMQSEAYHRSCDEAAAESEVWELEEEWSEANADASEVLSQIMEIPARTLAGLQAKTRAILDSDWELDRSEWRSFAAELLAVRS